MSVRLDRCVTAGPARVAAVVRETLSSHRIGRGAVFHGGKRPLAILVALDGACRAYDMRGRELDRARVEAICPGAWEHFASGGEV